MSESSIVNEHHSAISGVDVEEGESHINPDAPLASNSASVGEGHGRSIPVPPLEGRTPDEVLGPDLVPSAGGARRAEHGGGASGATS